MRLLQHGGGHRPELVVERSAQRLVGGQRIRLAPRLGQRPHAQRAQALVERVLVGQLGQLRDVLGRRALLGGGGQQVDARGEPHVVQAQRVRHRLAAPEVQRLGQQPHGAGGITRAKRSRALAREPLEPQRVDGVGRQRQPVAGRLLDDERRVPERPAQARDERLQRVLHVARRVALPHGVGQRAVGHGTPGVDREPGQERLQPAAGDLARRSVVLDQQRAQDRDVHG